MCPLHSTEAAVISSSTAQAADESVSVAHLSKALATATGSQLARLLPEGAIRRVRVLVIARLLLQ